jgi:hypothetical protein
VTGGSDACPTGKAYAYAGGDSCTLNTCEVINDCATCKQTSGCDYCSDSVGVFGAGICILGACTHNDSTAVCPADLCKLLPCSQARCVRARRCVLR